jgi:hypothetical protein
MLEMSKLIPEIVKNFDLVLEMPKEQWKTVNYWFVKPERLPVTVKCNVKPLETGHSFGQT